MFVHRRIALACAIGALAVTPGTASALPATDPPPPKAGPPIEIAVPQATASPASREIQTDGGDATLALVFSGSALLIAAGAAALSGHDHRRLGKVA